MSIITVPFSWLLMTLYNMFENYGVDVSRPHSPTMAREQ